MDLVPSHRLENGLSSKMMIQDENLKFPCGAAQGRPNDPCRQTMPVSCFVDEKMFAIDRDRFFRSQGAEFRRGMYESPDRLERPHNQDWNAEGSTGTQSGEGSEGDGEEDDDDDDEEENDEGDGEVEGLVAVDDGNKNNNSSGSVQSSSHKIRGEKANLQKHHPSFGSSRGMMMKDNGIVPNNIRGSLSEQQHQQGRIGHYDNAITIAPDIYYAQMIQAGDGSSLMQKEIGGGNACGSSGRKDAALSAESGVSLRAILSDPITGTLMDDAIILSCGHSFGSGGMQHIIRMKSCSTCHQRVCEDSFTPNFALRSAVQAFCREEELQSSKASKRKRDKFEQENSSYGDQFPVDLSRGKGVQFPFAVTDWVIIKGNKRTPQRFVGREAVVTTQCLNGWYVVKTLDSAESVKLQYRSLAKIPDNPSSSTIPNKTSTPNWL